MSYDVMVFDPDIAPAEREDFLNWFGEQSEWSEDHSYDDPKVCSQNLRAWFLEMIAEYPAMNGPYALGDTDDPDNPEVTDYSVGKSIIYAGFAWSVASSAHSRAISLAKKHGVGFFDVSNAQATIWRPGSSQSYDVFFRLDATDETVDSSRPVPMQIEQLVSNLLPKMVSDGDFIGLYDVNGTTLQFMYHLNGDRLWLEVPSPADEGSYGGFVSREALIEKLSNLPDSLSANDFPELRFESWTPDH